jgi:hypothetical protein
MDKNTNNAGGGFLSGETKSEEARSWTPWIIAGSVVVIIALLLVVVGNRSHKVTSTTPDPYASQLALGGIALSQSSNMAGSQLTYVDGTITNHGDRTVDGVTVRTTFHGSGDASGASQPQAETSPLSLITSRDPYIDTAPVSSNPIKPGEQRAFRLTFDHVSPDWNQQNPDLQIMQVHFK